MRTSIANRFLFLAILVFAACDKTETTSPTNPPVTTNGENFSSTESFFAKIAIPMQKFTVNASAGGNFTTLQGTAVSIPPNCFRDANNNVVTGNVTVEFKDLYQKSDMLFSQMPTTTINDKLLKSAGEFFIRVKQGNAALALGDTITVQQPLNGLPFDANMVPFIAVPDSTKKGTIRKGWKPQPRDSIPRNPGSYVYTLYRFSSPLVDSGTWCNSDNSAFFSAYNETILTLHGTDDVDSFDTELFLVFKGIRAMVHMYGGGGGNFPYGYAPMGLQCTAVAVGVRHGKVYSAFVPITISNMQTVNFTLSETTEDAFKAVVKSLN